MKQVWKRLIGDVGQIHPRPQHARADGLWHTAGPKAEWAEMWRPGPWPIMARAACGTRRMGNMVTVATAVMVAWPVVAQQRSPVASGGEQSSGGEEKGKRLGGSPKMGRGSRARRTPARCRWKAPERRRPLGGESCPWLPMNG
jgi:hypothetical protein